MNILYVDDNRIVGGNTIHAFEALDHSATFVLYPREWENLHELNQLAQYDVVVTDGLRDHWKEVYEQARLASKPVLVISSNRDIAAEVERIGSSNIEFCQRGSSLTEIDDMLNRLGRVREIK